MAHSIKENSTNQENKKHLSDRCSVNDTLAFIGKRWLMAILYEISTGHTQFSSLLNIFSGLSEHILASRVRDLYQTGLIIKMPLPDSVPMQINYLVTEKGRNLLEIINGLHSWTDSWNKELAEQGAV